MQEADYFRVVFKHSSATAFIKGRSSFESYSIPHTPTTHALPRTPTHNPHTTMPSFNVMRALRRSKHSSPSPPSSPASSTSTLVNVSNVKSGKSSSRVGIPFESMYEREGLLSIEEAQRRYDVKYHSVSHLPGPEIRAAVPSWGAQKEATYTFISLREAQARSDVKYRCEGFEMREHQDHILEVRADPDEKLPLKEGELDTPWPDFLARV